MEFNLILLLIGVICFLFSALILFSQLKSKRKNTETVKAEVKGYFTSVELDGEYGTKTETYAPILRYYVKGEWYENRTDTATGKKKYEIGQQIDIMYNPENPQRFYIVGEKSSYMAGIIGILVGIGLSALAFVIK